MSSKMEQKMRKIARQTYKSQDAKDSELKYKANNYAWAINTTGSVTVPLSTINPGLQPNQRVGNEIRLSSHTLRLNVTNGDPTNVVRFGLVYTNVPVTAVSQILSDLVTLGPNSGYDPEVVKSVVFDKLITLASFFNGGTAIRHAVMRKKDKHIIKWDSLLASADPVKGFLYFYAVSDSTIAPHPRLTAQLFTRYTDQ